MQSVFRFDPNILLPSENVLLPSEGCASLPLSAAAAVAAVVANAPRLVTSASGQGERYDEYASGQSESSRVVWGCACDIRTARAVKKKKLKFGICVPYHPPASLVPEGAGFLRCQVCLDTGRANKKNFTARLPGTTK